MTEFDKFMDRLRNFLKTYRSATGVTYAALAAAAGVSNTTVRNVTEGLTLNPTIHTVWKLLHACGASKAINPEALTTVRSARQKKAA